MPQEFCAVKCFKCEVFQVDILKKANKWTCKLCCTRQSIMQKFGSGTSKHCREIVQNLNIKHKNSKDLNLSFTKANISDNDSKANYLEMSENKAKKSKWTKIVHEVVESVDIISANEIIHKKPNLGKHNLFNTLNSESTKYPEHFKIVENKNRAKRKANKLFNLDFQDTPILDDIY